MASITKKPNGSYLIRTTAGKDENGKYKSISQIFRPSSPSLSYSALKKELDDFVADFEGRVKNGTFATESANHIKCNNSDQENDTDVLTIPKQAKTPFNNFCKLYLETKKIQLSPLTIHFYNNVINTLLIPFFGYKSMETFTVSDIQAFINSLSTKARKDVHTDGGTISGNTVIRYTTVLRSIVSYAYQIGVINEDLSSSRKLVFPKESKEKIDVYTEDEVRKILISLQSEPIQTRTMFELFIFTGCRRGEVAGLKWGDVDFQKAKITIERSLYQVKGSKPSIKPPKTTGSIRTISIPNKLLSTLKAFKANREALRQGSTDSDNFIFCQADGSVISPMSPTRQWTKFLKRNGIRQLKLHGLRHTSATLLLTEGVDIKTVSTRLGHSDLETTNIYVHMLEESDRKSAEVFDNLIKTK